MNSTNSTVETSPVLTWIERTEEAAGATGLTAVEIILLLLLILELVMLLMAMRQKKKIIVELQPVQVLYLTHNHLMGDTVMPEYPPPY